ncbi:MAG: hypothetical protein ACYS8X_01105 [Planctomycetota bacterium]|jgi:hypothetical protein
MSFRQLLCLLTLTVLATGGCGGYYILSAPDQVAPAGKDAPVVVRMQRNDFFVLDLAWKEAFLRFSIDNGPERIAVTGPDGYAGTMVPTPPAPGHYVMTIDYQDPDGEEVGGLAPVYSWEPQQRVVAVDLDGLPIYKFFGAAEVSAEALSRIARSANIVYMTRRSVREHHYVHDALDAAGYPSGPVLRWQRERYHLEPWKYKMQKVVVESRLVSQLEQLRKSFPHLTMGITDNTLAAKAFAAAGLEVRMIGGAKAPDYAIVERTSWGQLASEGLFADETPIPRERPKPLVRPKRPASLLDDETIGRPPRRRPVGRPVDEVVVEKTDERPTPRRRPRPRPVRPRPKPKPQPDPDGPIDLTDLPGVEKD